MFEIFHPEDSQNEREKPRRLSGLFKKIRAMYESWVKPTNTDNQPITAKERVSPEIILFNQEQIHVAMEKIHLQLRRTSKKRGVIASEELQQKDKDGTESLFTMRYIVHEDGRLRDDSYAMHTMTFRVEMFKGGKQETELVKPSFILLEGLDEDDEADESKVQRCPDAYLQVYYQHLPQIDPVADGMTLNGFIHTSKNCRGLGVATKLFEEVHTDALIRDFIKRTKHVWKVRGLSEEITTAACIFTDTTYLYGGSNRFWTTRMMERLGIEKADQNKYKYHDENIYVKKISLV